MGSSYFSSIESLLKQHSHSHLKVSLFVNCGSWKLKETVLFVLNYNKYNAGFFNFVFYLNFPSWKICVVFSRPQFLCSRPLWPRTSAFGSLYPMKNMTSFLWVCAKSLLLSFARQTTLYSYVHNYHCDILLFLTSWSPAQRFN